MRGIMKRGRYFDRSESEILIDRMHVAYNVDASGWRSSLDEASI